MTSISKMKSDHKSKTGSNLEGINILCYFQYKGKKPWIPSGQTYPPLRSGWFWSIFNLSSTAIAGSSRPSTKSVNTLLPLLEPEAFSEASLFKSLTCKGYQLLEKMKKNKHTYNEILPQPFKYGPILLRVISFYF